MKLLQFVGILSEKPEKTSKDISKETIGRISNGTPGELPELVVKSRKKFIEVTEGIFGRILEGVSEGISDGSV